jgi:transcriptional regulator with XRE-family HTH domain
MDFYSRFLALCNSKGVSPSAAVEAIDSTRASVTRWKSGAIPSDATLLKLASYFGVTPEYLKTGNDEGEVDAYDEFLELLKSDPDSRAILKSYGSSNKEDRARITRMVKALKGKEDD